MKYFISIAFLCIGLSLNAQSSKVSKSTFFVDGVCQQCKDRIENAAMRTKGVKTANWDKTSKQLTVEYSQKKTDIETIKLAVVDKGHDSDTHKSDTTAYSQLPKCCKYRDGAKCH